jgi:hypothetical protein
VAGPRPDERVAFTVVPAETGGLRRGDLLVGGGNTIRSLADLAGAISASTGDVTPGAGRGDATFEVTIPAGS